MKLKMYIKNPKGSANSLIKRIHNAIIALKTYKLNVLSDIKELNEIIEHSSVKTDISDHLVTLFLESVSIQPKLIVELGVRGGESTFVLERVARICNSKLISVDIEDCSSISLLKNWIFIQKDDIEFAREFEKWCKKNRIKPEIDILFIDTSHLFEHTLKEIEYWFPFLSSKSKVFFHDTNLKGWYFRKDGSMDYAWDNKRGVIRALEQYFDRHLNEKSEFFAFVNGWFIKHQPHCNGFTILEKLQIKEAEK